MELEDRLKKAEQLHRSGYNCSQCVMMAFSDVTEVSDDVVVRVGTGLGRVLGLHGGICGAVNGGVAVLGMTRPADPKEKVRIGSDVDSLVEEFRGRNLGYLHCKKLRGYKNCRLCDALIADVIEMLHNRLNTES